MNFIRLIFFISVFSLLSDALLREVSAQEVIRRTNKISNSIVNERGEYFPISVRELIDMSWKYGLFEHDDYSAISELLLANNCEVYEKYIHDDFSWNRIIESKKREISYYDNSVPDRYVLSDVIRLSRYDFDKKLFYINSQYVLNNAGIIDLYDMHNFEWPACPVNRSTRITSYPSNFRIKVINPLSMDSFPITPKEAENLIRKFQSENNYKREMYSRIYLRISGVDSSRLRSGVGSSITYKGQVERIELFSDIEGKNLVYEQNFR
jgi:hypothetical protein